MSNPKLVLRVTEPRHTDFLLQELGGEDFSERVVDIVHQDLLRQRFKEKFPKEILDPHALSRFLADRQRLKKLELRPALVSV